MTEPSEDVLKELLAVVEAFREELKERGIAGCIVLCKPGAITSEFVPGWMPLVVNDDRAVGGAHISSTMGVEYLSDTFAALEHFGKSLRLQGSHCELVLKTLKEAIAADLAKMRRHEH